MEKVKRISTIFKWIAVPVVALLALGAVILFFKQSQKITINEDMYQYFSGVRIDYIAKSILTKEEEGVLLENNGIKAPLDSTPIFYAKKDRLFLPIVMTYYSPVIGKLAKLDYFTEIYTGAGIVKIQRGKENIDITSGFAFDGRDTYVFLEPMTVILDNEAIRIMPLSYATVTYNQEVNLYIYGEERFITMALPPMGFTAESDSGYIINLNTDILIGTDGREQLIFNKPELLTPIDEVLNNK